MGKSKYIETPIELYKLFEKYIEWCLNNPVTREDFVGGAGKQVTRTYERPLTMSGFRVFGHKEGVTILHYFNNSEGAYEDYRTICRVIEDEIRQYQITGGLLGLLNPSITQRLNSLTEKQETTHKGEAVKDITVTIIPPKESGD